MHGCLLVLLFISVPSSLFWGCLVYFRVCSSYSFPLSIVLLPPIPEHAPCSLCSAEIVVYRHLVSPSPTLLGGGSGAVAGDCVFAALNCCIRDYVEAGSSRMRCRRASWAVALSAGERVLIGLVVEVSIEEEGLPWVTRAPGLVRLVVTVLQAPTDWSSPSYSYSFLPALAVMSKGSKTEPPVALEARDSPDAPLVLDQYPASSSLSRLPPQLSVSSSPTARTPFLGHHQ